MAESTTTATLVIRRGARKGRKFTLREDAFRIGREESCDLVLKDDLVSPLHTIIEPRGDAWVAVNRGMNGTLVNQEPVEGSRPLASGDAIQVGGETLLGFELIVEKKRAKKAPETRTATKPLWQRPIVLGGLGVYLLGLLGLVLYLSRGDITEGLDRQSAGLIMTQLEECLEQAAGSADGTGIIPDDSADLGADYYRLVSGKHDTQEVIDRLSGRVEEWLKQARIAEAQRKWSAAIAWYGKISEAVPNASCQVRRYATARVADLERRVR